jgi:hypothetical protein
MADYDEKEDLMDRLVALGRRKKFLSFDELNREIPNKMMSPDDIEDVLTRLEGANIDLAVVRQAVQKHRQRISLAKAELEDALAVKFCERTLSRFLKNLMPVTNASGDDRKASKTRRFIS